MVSELKTEPYIGNSNSMSTRKTDWTERHGLYTESYNSFTKGVNDILCSPLLTNKEPSKFKTLSILLRLPGYMKDLVLEIIKITMEFLFVWAKPKTIVQNSLKILKSH